MDADQANTSQNIRKREVTQVPEKQTSSALPIRTTSNGAVHTRTGTDLESQKRIGGFKGWVQALLHPNKAKPSKVPPLRTCLWNIMKYSWLNLLLAFIPVSWAMHFAHLSDTVIFVFSFLAIIPLASLLGFATEELALRVGPTLGGLLNATVSISAPSSLCHCRAESPNSAIAGSAI
jgi:Ca2+:H+ antiporter